METTRGGWGQGSLTEVGKGVWRYRLPKHLGRGQFTIRATTRTAALREAQRIRAEAADDRPLLDRPITFDEACEFVLSNHGQDPHSTQRLEQSLKDARSRFGSMLVSDIRYEDLKAWRASLTARLSPITVHGYTTAVKQVLNDCVKRGRIRESPGRGVENPRPEPGAVFPFETLDQVLSVQQELPPEYKALPMFCCGTGLRPEEWLALERGDIRGGFIHVNKRFVRGVEKPGTKNGQRERRVPVTPIVAEALRMHPTRLDTRLLFPARRGGHLILNDFRDDVWKPALRAAGIEPLRRLKDMRHTFATWQLTGNCNTWTLSKVMGTSVQQIELTYGRWIPGSEEVVLAAMEAFVERTSAAR